MSQICCTLFFTTLFTAVFVLCFDVYVPVNYLNHWSYISAKQFDGVSGQTEANISSSVFGILLVRGYYSEDTHCYSKNKSTNQTFLVVNGKYKVKTAL